MCGVKPHVLRYWEQEFTHLRPMKRRGNRRYYQHHEVLMIRRIRDLLYDQGFTISGARNKLQEGTHTDSDQRRNSAVVFDGLDVCHETEPGDSEFAESSTFGDSEFLSQFVGDDADSLQTNLALQHLELVRRELFEIRDLLGTSY